MGFKRSRALVMPEFGVIKGGRLDGWRYRFLRFEIRDHELLVLARCSAPDWPFPCEIPLTPTHFTQLRAVPGDRAKRLAAEPLIQQAYEAAGLPVPWWAKGQTMTLRARIKRARPRPYPTTRTTT